MAELRESLVRSLRMQFEREMERSLQRIQEAVSPYTRFVRAERGKLAEMQTGLESTRNQLAGLKSTIEEW